MIGRILKFFLRRYYTFVFRNVKEVYCVVSNDDNQQTITGRFQFYFPNKSVVFITDWNLLPRVQRFHLNAPILTTSKDQAPTAFRYKVFDINHQTNHDDGWAWLEAVNYQLPSSVIDAQLRASLNNWSSLRNQLSNKLENDLTVNAFGTGPSLAKAIDRHWEGAINIVCNTIVKDKELFDHIRPDIIVAGDAIYHFGFTQFAIQFRKDLLQRLTESQTYFVYPALFHSVIIREFGTVKERLIPIPSGKRKTIHPGLETAFSLPNLGNVLNLLLLPLSISFGRNIKLWGFDGRAPSDKLFWSNSSKHSYPELIDSLKDAHPAFFSFFVPQGKEKDYVKNYHGDQLDRELIALEKLGYSIEILHDTWTPTLRRRFKGTKTLDY